MKRKIGEVFEYQGKKLRVEETKNGGCDGCFFHGEILSFCNELTSASAGHCDPECRTDKKDVIFVEITEEQPQEQPQELNLCEILKYCPEGETFWSPMLGDVKFYDINQNRKLVTVNLENRETWNFNSDGTISFGGTTTSPEIMLYPSREQRDWAKVKYEPKKERFDPKTLKPFDRILTRDEHYEFWSCDIFSHISEDEPFKYITISNSWKYCIPYNDDTKHLVGTKDEAPEYYRYWEDC